MEMGIFVDQAHRCCHFPSKTLLGLKQSHSLGLEVTIKIILGIGWDLPGRFFHSFLSVQVCKCLGFRKGKGVIP